MILEALKEFKKTLKRRQREQEFTLSNEILTAILLLIAVRYIEKRHCDMQSNSTRPVKEWQLNAPSRRDNCGELYSLLSALCSKEIGSSLPKPDRSTITVAKDLLGEKLLDMLADDLSSLGFTYQIFNMTERQSALLAVQQANKVISPDQLIAFTQLYTPGWVVDFLLANTVLPILQQSSFENPRFLQWQLELKQSKDPIAQIHALKLIDPACGAGHFLIAAFDLLFDLYIEAGADKQEAIRLILKRNLHGADIDSSALWVTCLCLLTKSLVQGALIDELHLSNICCSDLSSVRTNEGNGKPDILGSLSRQWLERLDHPLAQKYQVVVTNPPYIGRKLLSRDLKTALQEHYPDSHADLCAAFVRRCLEMLAPNGRMGVITQSSLLTLSSYKNLRSYLDSHFKAPIIVNCGTRVFPLSTGEKIDSMLLIARPKESQGEPPDLPKKSNGYVSSIPANHSIYLKLINADNKAEQLKQLSSEIQQNTPKDDSRKSQLKIAPPRKFSDDYLPASLRQILLNAPNLSTVAEVRQGLATTDNKRFVRYFWDVDQKDLGTIWVPYVKGAGSERWYSENNFVVKWGKDGSEIKQAVSEAYPYLKGKTAWVVKNEDFYFRPGLCFSFINKTHLAVRRLPPNCIFDVASSAIFPEGNKEDENFLFAYLNSALLSTIANTINPTINLQVGDIKRLPLFPMRSDIKIRLGQLAQACYKTKFALANMNVIADSGLGRLTLTDRTANHFTSSLDLETIFIDTSSKLQDLEEQLDGYEKEIDALVFDEVAACAGLTSDTLSDLKNWIKQTRTTSARTNTRSQDATESLSTGRGALHAPAPALAIIGNADASETSIKNKANTFQLSRATFAARVLIECIRSLLSHGTIEQIVIHPIIDESSLPKLLGLDSQSVRWLESALKKDLASYFLKSQVLDLSKIAKTPRRYFSILLPDSNSLLLFSTQAFRYTSTLLKSDNQSPWQISKEIFLSLGDTAALEVQENTGLHTGSIFDSAIAESEPLIDRINMVLSSLPDWTSKDLIAAVELSIGTTRSSSFMPLINT